MIYRLSGEELSDVLDTFMWLWDARRCVQCKAARVSTAFLRKEQKRVTRSGSGTIIVMNLSIFPSSTVDCRPGTGDILLIILSSLNHNIDLSTYPPSNCATSPKHSRCWFWVEALVDLTATLLAPEKDPQNALFQFWIQLGRNVFLSRKPWSPILQRNGKTDRKPDIPSRLRNSSNGKVATEIWIIAFHSISLHAATSAHVAAQALVVKLHPPAGQNLDPTGPSTESVAAYDAGTCITVRDKRDNFKFELEHVYDVEEIRHTLQIR